MINKYRKEIDEIDLEIQKLFLKRLEVVKQVKQYKQANNLSVEDLNRERNILENLKITYPENETWQYYQDWMNHLFRISKDVQND